MALFFASETQDGSEDDDFMFGHPTAGPDHTISGNGGDDLIFGDFDFFFSRAGTNASLPQSINETRNVVNTFVNPDNGSEEGVPKQAIFREVTSTNFDFYSVTLTAGQSIIIDLDYGSHEIGESFDGQLDVFQLNGPLLASNDDSNASDGGRGSTSDLDPFLEFIAPFSGTFVIRVGRFSSDGGDPLQIGDTYMLNFSSDRFTPTDDTIMFGDDLLDGGKGNDVIYGRKGEDTLLGGEGDDLMDGGEDNDEMDGGEGDDLMLGAAGDDTMRGGDGLDTMFGDFGDDNMNGKRGDDDMKGQRGDDTMFGGLGNDTMIGGLGADSINGSIGRDELRGLGGRDTLNGSGGKDDIVGGGGRDLIIGGKGGDTLKGGGGLDIFQFKTGDGRDTITDFRQKRDKIEITNGAESFEDLNISQQGDDVFIRFANVRIRVEDDSADAFSGADFIFS
ncbi:MAG: pre-peptidase C-terminal domain-containing protein [Pseudomonadota bacterium]